MLSIAICDDEKKVCEYLKSRTLDYLAQQDFDANISLFFDGNSLADAYRQHHADFNIIFLDIKMKNMNGISVAKEIRKFDTHALIIFITSSAEYVFRGYEVKAFRYILKNELETSFERILRECINELHPDDEPVFSFSVGRESVSLPLSEILYFESERRVINIVTNKEKISFYDKLSAVEQKLTKSDFVRCHQSYLVNAKCIKSINALQLTLLNGTVLPISKSKLKNTKDAFLWTMR